MTDIVDICNRALQVLGTRTTVTAAELENETTNEAKQFNLCYQNNRNDLLRMAPWNCALLAQNMDLITSVPGTPQNLSPATPLWERGQPMPPWAYEYQYPVDCLRPCWVIPGFQTGYAGSVPIYPVTTANTGYMFGGGPPVKFKVAVDLFYPVTAAVVAAGGSGYAVGEIVTLVRGADTDPPIGAPAKLRVLTVNGSGAILTCEVITQVLDQTVPPYGGSYFLPQDNPVAADFSDGDGTGATFTLTFGDRTEMRTILCNQEYATLAYIKLVENPNVWDTLFQTALINVVAANICMALTGDKDKANKAIGIANNAITVARTADGNEGLTINDVTPDFIRIRGILPAGDGYGFGPYSGFDWGPMWPTW